MHSMHKPAKLKFHSSEKWVAMRGYKGADGQRYAISNFGRAIAFWNEFDFGYFLKCSLLRNYPGIHLRKNGAGTSFLVHRLVAEHFCTKPSARHKYVLHIDHKKENNYYTNLTWATIEETIAHKLRDPNFLKSRAESRGKGHKLTVDRVKIIKRKLKEGKTKPKLIAKQFGISGTLLQRIKAGTNWGHVTI